MWEERLHIYYVMEVLNIYSLVRMLDSPSGYIYWGEYIHYYAIDDKRFQSSNIFLNS